jgi:hypothetical protein
MPYTWLTFGQAKAQLIARLQMTGYATQFWDDAECGLYIVEALRWFNSLTFTWKINYAFTPTNLWNFLGGIAGSPRERTVTDTDVYTIMEYHLLEPPTGNTWTGTTQFTITDLSTALQKRRDELIQVSNCNQVLIPNLAVVPTQTRYTVADTIIDVQRVRYIASPPPGITQPPVTLYRDDVLGEQFYAAGYEQSSPDVPDAFTVSTEPPLSFDVNIPPVYEGVFELLALQSGAAFDPVSGPTLLGIPDDFASVAKWGALGDLLAQESEATDRQRAAYCARRYQDGLNLLIKTPWLMLARINEQSCDMPSFPDKDNFAPEWDSSPSTLDTVVIGGTDTVACPPNSSMNLMVLGNALIPSADADPVQVSRSNWDSILDYAQFLAAFKQGGEEFESALELEANFIQMCAAENSRLKSLGLFSDVLVQRAGATDRKQERYSSKEQ